MQEYNIAEEGPKAQRILAIMVNTKYLTLSDINF